MPKSYPIVSEEIILYKSSSKMDSSPYNNQSSLIPTQRQKLLTLREAREKGFVPGVEVIRTYQSNHRNNLRFEDIGVILQYQMQIRPQEFKWYPILVRFPKQNNYATDFGYEIKDLVLYNSTKPPKDLLDYGNSFD